MAMTENNKDTLSLDSGRTLRTPALARIAAGIAAGIIGGILMMGSMMAAAEAAGAGIAMPLKAIGAMPYGVEALVEGPKAMITGATIALSFSIILGIVFAQFVSRRASIFATLAGGTALGAAVWIVMGIFVLPAEDPTMSARMALMPIGFFAANLLLGFGLATTPIFVRGFSRKRRKPLVAQPMRQQPA